MTHVWDWVDTSETNRSKSVLKIVKNLDLMKKLRYTIVRCVDCAEWFDKEDTTRGWLMRQVYPERPEPVICEAYWQQYKIICCTDCIKRREDNAKVKSDHLSCVTYLPRCLRIPHFVDVYKAQSKKKT